MPRSSDRDAVGGSPVATVSLPEVAHEDVVAVARRTARVELAPEARAAMQRSSDVVAALAASDEPVYGVSTGFGSLATVPITSIARQSLRRD